MIPLQDQVQLFAEFVTVLAVHLVHKLEVGAVAIALSQPPFPHSQFIICKLHVSQVRQELQLYQQILPQLLRAVVTGLSRDVVQVLVYVSPVFFVACVGIFQVQVQVSSSDIQLVQPFSV
ncbi:MAG: hypothetical protein LBC61_01140 [Candidatus Peribacteria bacterium]|nr:hypothetical protein [Candidatus Peribacteria bacterium]